MAESSACVAFNLPHKMDRARPLHEITSKSFSEIVPMKDLSFMSELSFFHSTKTTLVNFSCAHLRTAKNFLIWCSSINAFYTQSFLSDAWNGVCQQIFIWGHEWRLAHWLHYSWPEGTKCYSREIQLNCYHHLRVWTRITAISSSDWTTNQTLSSQQ